MANLMMCRICLSTDRSLQLITDTHLQQVFECLALMPLLTNDRRPVHACLECYSSLEFSDHLRKKCLQSEEMFTQLLCNAVQVRLTKVDSEPDVDDMFEDTCDLFEIEEIKLEEKDTADVPGDVDPGVEGSQLSDDAGGESSQLSDDAAAGDFVPVILKKETVFYTPDVYNPDMVDAAIAGPRTRNMRRREQFYCNTCLESFPSEAQLTRHIRTHIDVLGDVDAGVEGSQLSDDPGGEGLQLSDDAAAGDFDPVILKIETVGLTPDLYNPDMVDAAIAGPSTRNMRRREQFYCNTCLESFPSEAQLIRHIRTHIGKKSYKCCVCKKCIKSSFVTHTGNKAHNCSDCKTFITIILYCNVHRTCFIRHICNCCSCCRCCPL